LKLLASPAGFEPALPPREGNVRGWRVHIGTVE
jgi:hypothetical protein